MIEGYNKKRNLFPHLPSLSFAKEAGHRHIFCFGPIALLSCNHYTCYPRNPFSVPSPLPDQDKFIAISTLHKHCPFAGSRIQGHGSILCFKLKSRQNTFSKTEREQYTFSSGPTHVKEIYCLQIKRSMKTSQKCTS